MSRFKGLSGIKTNKGGVFFYPGSHLVELQEFKFLEETRKGNMFVISGRLLETDGAEIGKDWQPTGVENIVGSIPSQSIKMDPTYLESAWGNVKAAAGAFLGIDDPDTYIPEEAEGLEGEELDDAVDKFWAESLEYLVSDEQPLRGMVVRLSCVSVRKKDGNPFTKHTWGPIVEHAAEAAE